MWFYVSNLYYNEIFIVYKKDGKICLSYHPFAICRDFMITIYLCANEMFYLILVPLPFSI